MKTYTPKHTDLSVGYTEKKFVYVISHPNNPGEYKVGITKNCQSRLNAYQTSDHERQFKPEFMLETLCFRETEAFVHNKFPNRHEWVQAELEEIIKEIKAFKPAESQDLHSLCLFGEAHEETEENKEGSNQTEL